MYSGWLLDKHNAGFDKSYWIKFSDIDELFERSLYQKMRMLIVARNVYTCLI